MSFLDRFLAFFNAATPEDVNRARHPERPKAMRGTETHAPIGLRSVTFYTYDDRDLPWLRPGSRIELEHVRGRHSVTSVYTGGTDSSECCFAYHGHIVGIVFDGRLCQQLLKAQERHGRVFYWFTCKGRNAGGWVDLQIRPPEDDWFD